jgi:sugar phosphate isomerase/epimerase
VSKEDPLLKLGLVTYNLAKSWDISEIIAKCEATGFEAVELRTTHAHGVEPTLSSQERKAVKERFGKSKVQLLSLGTTCEFHSPDPAEVRRNIEEAKTFVRLAADVGAVGVKVRPNGFPDGVSKDTTIKQIGTSLRECGEFAKDYNIGIWLEVHGKGTNEVPYVRAMMDVANHPSVGICWNSNQSDVLDGFIRENFELVKPWIRNVHITELWREDYPWRELFALLKKAEYKGCTLAEIPESPEPERLMRYYRALWLCQGRG